MKEPKKSPADRDAARLAKAEQRVARATQRVAKAEAKLAARRAKLAAAQQKYEALRAAGQPLGAEQAQPSGVEKTP